MAQTVANRKGNPGRFQKGRRYNPDGEFKPGHRLTPEQEQKRSESIKRWYRLHPKEARQKAAKIWETRRSSKALKNRTLGSISNRDEGSMTNRDEGSIQNPHF